MVDPGYGMAKGKIKDKLVTMAMDIESNSVRVSDNLSL